MVVAVKLKLSIFTNAPLDYLIATAILSAHAFSGMGMLMVRWGPQNARLATVVSTVLSLGLSIGSMLLIFIYYTLLNNPWPNALSLIPWFAQSRAVYNLLNNGRVDEQVSTALGLLFVVGWGCALAAWLTDEMNLHVDGVFCRGKVTALMATLSGRSRTVPQHTQPLQQQEQQEQQELFRSHDDQEQGGSGLEMVSILGGNIGDSSAGAGIGLVAGLGLGLGLGVVDDSDDDFVMIEEIQLALNYTPPSKLTMIMAQAQSQSPSIVTPVDSAEAVMLGTSTGTGAAIGIGTGIGTGADARIGSSFGSSNGPVSSIYEYNRTTTMRREELYAIVIQHLHHEYSSFFDVHGHNSTVAVQDLSLTMRYGETFGLLGPNGGKQHTLLINHYSTILCSHPFHRLHYSTHTPL